MKKRIPPPLITMFCILIIFLSKSIFPSFVFPYKLEIGIVVSVLGLLILIVSVKSFINNNIKKDEFDALIKITAEMSKYLYPFIREILQSKEDPKKNSIIWDDFQKRFVELINERFNVNSIRVKKLLNQTENDEIIIKSLLTLSFCISNQGYKKLNNFLTNL